MSAPVPNVPSTIIGERFTDQNGNPTRIAQLHLSGTAQATNLMAGAFTGTVPLAKLTGGGAEGSLTFQNGVLLSAVAPT